MTINFRVQTPGTVVQQGECFVDAAGLVLPHAEGANAADARAARPPSPGDGASSARSRGAALALVELEPIVASSLSGRVHTCLVPADPTLDDMLAASFVECLTSGRELPAGARDFAEYAALARAGLRPGEVPLTESMEGVFLAIRNARGADLNDPATATAFFDRWRQFAERVLAAAAAGRDPYTTSILDGTNAFKEEQLYLAADQELYRQDVARGQRWTVALPGGPPRASGLLLRHPKSLLFKYWARQDEAAPCLGKYSFLAVTQTDLTWGFSTDPTDRLTLLPLAEKLQGAEAAATPAGETTYAWYDGSRHNHTLVAAPREGTRLSDSAVLRIVRKWCRARPVGRIRRTVLTAAASLGVLLLATWFGFHTNGTPDTPPEISRGRDAGEGSHAGEESNAGGESNADGGSDVSRDASRGVAAIKVDWPDVRRIRGRARALLFATEHYGDEKWEKLNRPIADVTALSDVLEREYGFKCEIVPDPDRDTLLKKLKQEVKRKYVPGDELLVYIAGHGHSESNMGWVVTRRPKGSIGEYDVLTDSQTLQHVLMGSKCPHVLLVLDICYGGMIFDDVAARGGPEEPAEDARDAAFVRDKLMFRSRAILTSGAKESVPDESAFARRLVTWLNASHGILTTSDLFSALDRGARPRPLFRTHESDEGGDFLFIHKGALEPKAGPLEPAPAPK